MRALIVSFLTLAVLIGCWGWFHQYSEDAMQDIVSVCAEEVMPAIESGQWETAFDIFDVQYQAWQQYEKRAYLMLETGTLNETDMAFAKTLMYIKAKDISNSSGELLALMESLRYLHENEALTLSNIL
ncbi:MAG: DUF4363 family protein [Firmicutes bacterium]|nr:DUF4363 family protein [Bacillota bacterium]